jgi:hypothetical protein
MLLPDFGASYKCRPARAFLDRYGSGSGLVYKVMNKPESQCHS